MPQGHIRKHIELIAKHEEEFLSRRSRGEIVGDAVSIVIGNLPFVFVHIAFVLLWVSINTGAVSIVHPFDPPPFPLLDVGLAFEGILLVSFVLMRQSRIARRTSERDQLELQLILLTEKELTRTLTICREMALKMGLKEIATDSELRELVKDTPVDELARDLQQKLPDE